MSVFKSIKGTFAAGLKSITSRDSTKQDSTIGLKTSAVNFDAGADLLARYQDVWKELHENCQENANRAENVDSQITELCIKYDQQQEVMLQLHESVVALPILVSQLQQATDLLASLEEEYEKVNTALVDLQDVIEEKELLAAQLIDTQKLSEYNERKQDELENFKVMLANSHAKKVQDVERKKRNLQKEKEDAFQDAFEDDLDYYKTYGHVDRVSISSSEGSRKLDIADVTLEEDDEALDEFLGSTEVTPSNENFPESSEENIYSEDDYLPKTDEDSDFIKSGDTVNSDSDADAQQQNSIQTWINDSPRQGQGHEEKCQGQDDKAES